MVLIQVVNRVTEPLANVCVFIFISHYWTAIVQPKDWWPQRPLCWTIQQNEQLIKHTHKEKNSNPPTGSISRRGLTCSVVCNWSSTSTPCSLLLRNTFRFQKGAISLSMWNYTFSYLQSHFRGFALGPCANWLIYTAWPGRKRKKKKYELIASECRVTREKERESWCSLVARFFSVCVGTIPSSADSSR